MFRFFKKNIPTKYDHIMRQQCQSDLNITLGKLLIQSAIDSTQISMNPYFLETLSKLRLQVATDHLHLDQAASTLLHVCRREISIYSNKNLSCSTLRLPSTTNAHTIQVWCTNTIKRIVYNKTIMQRYS